MIRRIYRWITKHDHDFTYPNDYKEIWNYGITLILCKKKECDGVLWSGLDKILNIQPEQLEKELKEETVRFRKEYMRLKANYFTTKELLYSRYSFDS